MPCTFPPRSTAAIPSYCVTEAPLALEPVSRDPFADGLETPVPDKRAR
jgi:hypothetical protein